MKILKQINKKLKIKNPNLITLFKQYWRSYRQVVFGMAIDIYFDDIVCQRLSNWLEQALNQRGQTDKFNDYYTTLTAPVKITTSQKEEIGFLKILLESKSKRQILFKKQLAKFAYLPIWFDNNPWQISDLNKRAKQYKGKIQIRNRLKELQAEIKNRRRKTKHIIKRLYADQRTTTLVKQIQEFAWLRHQGEFQIGYHNLLGLSLKKLICKNLNINLEQLKFLTDTEIVKNLKHRNPGLIKLIKERQKYCFVIFRNSQYLILTGVKAKKEGKKIKAKIKKEKIAPAKILKRVVGSLGKAKSKARIIMGLSEVVSGTSVEYLSAMQKAAGIISEIGGVTSHAAVVSRELKIPCLTRVSHATRLLKTGQLIELNANLGIIKTNISTR